MSPVPFDTTVVIGTGWSQHHRAAATGGMNATCQILAPGTGEPTVDPDTGEVTGPAGVPIWQGRCRVQATASQQARIEQALDEVSIRGYLVQLDETGDPVPAVDPEVHTVKVLTAVNDPQLVGRVLTVVDVALGSERFTRDLVCNDNLG